MNELTREWANAIQAVYKDETASRVRIPPSSLPGVVNVFYSQNGADLEASIGVSSIDTSFRYISGAKFIVSNHRLAQ